LKFYDREAAENVWSFLNATGLPGGKLRLLLTTATIQCARCHGLVPWIFTLDASDQREEPPGKPVVASDLVWTAICSGHRNDHGASPWHFQTRSATSR
jgi:hypothetical protein